MTISELQALLKTPDPRGCFLFCGEESYLRRSYLELFRKKILTEPDFDAFNHLVHEGADIDFAALTGDIDTPPFFTDAKMVEWHMADLNGMSDKKIEALAELCARAAEENNTVLVILTAPEGFDPGTAKRPSALYKKLSSVIRIVNFEKSTDAQLMNWLKRHFDHEGVGVDAVTLRALLDRSGHAMDILANEVEKLTAYVKANGRDTVTPADVAYVAAPTTESDAFGLTNAMLDGKLQDAFYHLSDLRARRVDPTVILGQLSRLYGDLLTIALLLEDGTNREGIAEALSMNAYKVSLYMKAASKRSVGSLRSALALLVEADKQVKTSYGNDKWAMLDKLVCALQQGS